MGLLGFNKGANTAKPAVRPARSGATSVIRIGKPKEKSAIFGGGSLGPLGLLTCALFSLLTALILDFGVLPPPYSPAMLSPTDFAARVGFSYTDPDEQNRLRQDAVVRAPHVYVEDPEWVENTVHELDRIVTVAHGIKSDTELADKAAAEHFSQDYSALLEEFYKSKDVKPERIAEMLRAALKSEFEQNAILTEDDYKNEINKPEPRQIERVSVKGGQAQPQTVDWKRYVRLADAVYAIKHSGWTEIVPWRLNRIISAYLDSKMKAALKLDEAATREHQSAAKASVAKREVSVARGTPILEKNAEIRAPALDRLRNEYRAVKDAQPLLARLKHLGALAALAAGMITLFLIAAGRSEPGVLKRRRSLVMLALFVLVALAGCRALLLAGVSLAWAPFIIVGMAASLAFGQTIALLSLLGLSVLSMVASIGWEAAPIDGGLPFLSAALLAGGVAAAIPGRELRDRWDLLRYGTYAGLLQGTLVAALSFLNAGTPGIVDAEGLSMVWPRSGIPTLADAVVAYANGPACALFVLGALPVIESLFGILTNIRLFELADLNQPALQRIQMETPGTFQHTLQVRFLAEPAAEIIGARTRLVSAGVLYHDLGKVLKPEYYVENSEEAEERHKRLKPSVSALLIISHVKDGMDLAREYKLPQQIIDFIPEHHGTTLVSYFYHNALKNAQQSAQDEGHDSHGGEVEEAFFRYPGPRPRSRETAIVMLADTVEAASRTLHNASATRLRQFVHDLIMEKMLDNQLDECGLTFSDLALIEDAFLRVLTTRYHSRIRYPGQDEDDQEAREREADEAEETAAALPAAAPATEREERPSKTIRLAKPDATQASQRSG